MSPFIFFSKYFINPWKTHECLYVIVTTTSPCISSFDVPVVVRPGDELRTTCTFNSEGVDKSTFFGKGSHDEMCFVFAKYYPKQKARIQQCLSFKELSMCSSFPETADLFQGGFKGCNIAQFTSITNPATLSMVFQVSACAVYVNETRFYSLGIPCTFCDCVNVLIVDH